MKVKKIYFEEELDCWEYIANFFELDTEKEVENDFENTKELLEKNHKEIYKENNIILYMLSYKNKILIELEDMVEEKVYFIEM